MLIMAKKRESKQHIALVDKNIGCNPDGTPKIILKKGEVVEGLSRAQITFYKQQKYIN